MVWGVWDKIDKVWMGDSKGPILFRESDEISKKLNGPRNAAMMSAAVLCERFGWEADLLYSRLQAKEFNEKNVRLKDTVTPIRSAEEAMERLKDPTHDLR